MCASALDDFSFLDMNSVTFGVNTVLACCDNVELASSQMQLKRQLTTSLSDTGGGVENFLGGCEF